MTSDDIDDLLRLTVLAREIGADRHMGPLNLMADRLSDVMQETAALGEHDITVKLRCHESRQMGDLDGVCKDVLPIARTIAHTPEETHEFRMNAVHSRLECRLLARLLDPLLDLAPCLLDHLLNACGMDASVLNQLFKRNACDLTPHGVKP